MSATQLESILANRFDAAAAAHVDIVVALASNDGERLTTLAVQQGALRFDHGVPSGPVDATLFFDRRATALGIFSGSVDPMAAFMAGVFRADGHLPLVFTLLGLFRADYGATPPE